MPSTVVKEARVVLNGVSAAAAVTVTAIGVATVLPIVAKEAGVVRMPSAAVVVTAAEVNKPHLK